MAEKYYRTNNIAKALGIHVNTVRLYEADGFLPEIPRGQNGYRQYTQGHLEQARLAHLTLHWPWVGDKTLLIDLVKTANCGDLDKSMELAYHYLARIRMEKTYAEAAIDFLERWSAGYITHESRQKLHISETAQYLNVTVDMLRNWERNGLISVPRDPTNQYRLYGSAEIGRLRVIRILIQSGFSLMAILKMLNQFDDGKTDNLGDVLNMPLDESINEAIEVIADRRLDSLIELENRAQAIIHQIKRLYALTLSK